MYVSKNAAKCSDFLLSGLGHQCPVEFPVLNTKQQN